MYVPVLLYFIIVCEPDVLTTGEPDTVPVYSLVNIFSAATPEPPFAPLPSVPPPAPAPSAPFPVFVPPAVPFLLVFGGEPSPP